MGKMKQLWAEEQERKALEAMEGPSALDIQVAGEHYKDMAIQPIVFCQKNGLNACETHAIGYITRHDKKGEGAKDIRKAIHMLEILLELDYGEEVQEQVRDDGERVPAEDLPLRKRGPAVHPPTLGTQVHTGFCTKKEDPDLL